MSESTASNNWRTHSLSELAQYHNGLAFKPSDWVKQGTAIIRIEQLNNPTGEYGYFDGTLADIAVSGMVTCFSFGVPHSKRSYGSMATASTISIYSTSFPTATCQAILVLLARFQHGCVGRWVTRLNDEAHQESELRTYRVEFPPSPNNARSPAS